MILTATIKPLRERMTISYPQHFRLGSVYYKVTSSIRTQKVIPEPGFETVTVTRTDLLESDIAGAESIGREEFRLAFEMAMAGLQKEEEITKM